MFVTELDDAGQGEKRNELPFKFSMMLPAFKGVDAVAAVEGLCNPRGFVLIDEHQRSRKYATSSPPAFVWKIPPVEATPVPTGAPKTGYMIETMVTAIVHNIAAELNGKAADAKGTWNAICPGRHGRHRCRVRRVAADPATQCQLVKKGRWVHLAKVAFRKAHFMYKMKNGSSEPVYRGVKPGHLELERLEGDQIWRAITQCANANAVVRVQPPKPGSDGSEGRNGGRQQGLLHKALLTVSLRQHRIDTEHRHQRRRARQPSPRKWIGHRQQQQRAPESHRQWMQQNFPKTTMAISVRCPSSCSPTSEPLITTATGLETVASNDGAWM